MNDISGFAGSPNVSRLLSARLTCVLLIASLTAAVRAQDLKLQPFSYREGFEGACPAVELWAKNGPSTVAFCGSSEEKACEGRRSLKFDVKLDGGSYHYFGVKVNAPCLGKLKLSARVLVAEGTSVRVGFGTNMVYPPTRHSGCGPAKTFDGPTDGWQVVEIDLVARGANGASKVMADHTAMTRGQDVGATLDRWSLFILGGKGKRAIVYVDDVRIEGQVPSEADYRKEIDARWQKRQKRLAGRIDGWRKQLAEARKAFKPLTDPPQELRPYTKSFEASIETADRLIAKLARGGYGSKQDHAGIEASLRTIRHGPETVEAIVRGLAEGRPYLLYTPPAITNHRFATNTFPIPARVGTQLSCSGCRGEYESVTLVVYALKNLEHVTVTATDLTGPGGTIPASAVDVHIVKCWYQAARQIWCRIKTKLLAPELLLKDDRLVRVDLAKKANYVRSTAADGQETYLLCSGPTSDGLKSVRPVDADTLQPVDIPARSMQQFWLTVHIPKDAKPGVYRGRVQISSKTGSGGLPIELTVHPFGLLPSRLVYSIYYRGKLSPDGRPTIGSESKSEQQYRAEIEDMKAHGVLYPTSYQPWDERLLRRVLEIRREVGLPTGRFYNLGRWTGSPTKPAELARLREEVRRWISFCRPFGYDEVYFYGIDEAKGDRLKSQRTAWQTVHDAGGKIFVAGYKGTFEAMGKLLSTAVLASRPNPEEARKWHSVGSHAFCYAYPQVGNEEPETYRRNFGLVLWKAGFDGAMDYAYQHAFGHIWNDFDHTVYRDHNFTYPTVNGVVGTIQWEGFREAVDDVRYVTTLEHAIKAAPPAKADVAKRACTWLADLDPDAADLYETREQMARFIKQLR